MTELIGTWAASLLSYRRIFTLLFFLRVSPVMSFLVRHRGLRQGKGARLLSYRRLNHLLLLTP